MRVDPESYKKLHMKQILIMAAALTLTCCGSGDKRVELEKMRAEYAELGERIRTAEAQIKAEGGDNSAEVKAIESQGITLQPFTRRVIVQGMVDGDEIITLNPRASGEVVMLNAEVGQSVRAGEVLVKIDDKILRKGLDELHTALELASTVYERQAALWRDSIGSEIQYIQAKNQKEALEKKVASLEEQIDLYQIKAPINGTIEKVDTKLGQMVSPQQPVAMMINLDKLKVVAEVSESYSNVVRRGDKIDVRFPDINKDYELTITSVSNFINPKNRTFSLEAKLPGGISDVKANMLAKVAIESYSVPQAVVVPVNVIFKNVQGEYLFIVEQEGDKRVARKRFVKTGVMSDNAIEILEGLSQGDIIVTMGYQTLEDGAEIGV